MSDKTKWMAATGYILVMLDAFSVHLFNFYQFYIFGYYINLVTITPLIIYYAINKTHSQEFIINHLKRSIKIYLWYIVFSVISGVFFEVNNYWVRIGRIAITWLMLFVLVYVAVACGKGIIRAFKNELTPVYGKIGVTADSDVNTYKKRLIISILATVTLFIIYFYSINNNPIGSSSDLEVIAFILLIITFFASVIIGVRFIALSINQRKK